MRFRPPCMGRQHLEILKRTREVKNRALENSRRCSETIRAQGSGL